MFGNRPIKVIPRRRTSDHGRPIQRLRSSFEPAADRMESALEYLCEPLESAKTEDDSFLRVTGIDTSGVATTTTSGSWSAWCTCMLDTRTGNIYVMSVDRARNISFEELRLRVLAHLGTFNPDLCVIENASQGGRLGESIRGSSRTPVQLVEARQSKKNRVINILPLLEGGRIYIPSRGEIRSSGNCRTSRLQELPIL